MTTPNESAAYGVFGALAVATIYRKLSMFIRVEALKVSILMSAMISFFGFDPLLFWTLFLRNLTLGAVTPLFGYALFAFGASSPAEVRLRDIYGA